MDLHLRLNVLVVACCLLLVGLGCSTRSADTAARSGADSHALETQSVGDAHVARGPPEAFEAPAAFEGDWYYGSDCNFGHYVTLAIKRTKAGFLGDWSDGTRVHGSDGLLRGVLKDGQVRLDMCGQSEHSGLPTCPHYEKLPDVLERRGEMLVWWRGGGAYAHEYVVMHRQVGKVATIDVCEDEADVSLRAHSR